MFTYTTQQLIDEQGSDPRSLFYSAGYEDGKRRFPIIRRGQAVALDLIELEVPPIHWPDYNTGYLDGTEDRDYIESQSLLEYMEKAAEQIKIFTQTYRANNGKEDSTSN